MSSRWASRVTRRYRCDRCRRYFSRTIIYDPLTDWRDKIDPHFCGRRDCYPINQPGLFDNIGENNADSEQAKAQDEEV